MSSRPRHQRRQRDRLIINVSSWAGRHVGAITGPAYSAAKFGFNAMTESLNVEECIHGIRCTAVCPGEVSPPILDQRPVPVGADDRARLVQPVDCGELMLFLACMPAHVGINDLTISPTFNRAYVAQACAIGDHMATAWCVCGDGTQDLKGPMPPGHAR